RQGVATVLYGCAFLVQAGTWKPHLPGSLLALPFFAGAVAATRWAARFGGLVHVKRPPWAVCAIFGLAMVILTGAFYSLLS
ncbi:MAG: hypothetical protein ACYDGR_00215, partial [Candidatus Dormibacteria bacterium]